MALGVIEAVETINQVSAQGAGQSALMASAELNMFRGAIIGALLVGLAFLTGLAVLRRGALAYSSAFMVGTAAALELFWLGFLPAPSANLVVLLQGIFGASVIIFLSASVKLARNHAGLGGIMFAASLVFVGVGIINFLGRADFSSAMIRGLIGVSVFTLGLSAFQALRGDNGAKLVFPGALLVALGTVVFITGYGGPLLGHGLLTLGLLASSLVVFSEKTAANLASVSPLASSSTRNFAEPAQPQFSYQAKADSPRPGTQLYTQHAYAPMDAEEPSNPKQLSGAADQSVDKSGRKPAISGERLVEVLDFSGIGVWDWSVDGVYQSASLCEMLGADCEANFTPEALRAFVMPSHSSIFEAEILGHGTGDGGFDTQIVLHNSQVVRLRGARAVDSAGRLERVVAFFEVPMSPSDLAATSMMTAATVDEGKSPLLNVGLSSQLSEQSNADDSADISVDRSIFHTLAVSLSATPVKAITTGEVIGFDVYTASSGPDASSHGQLSWNDKNVVAGAFSNAAKFLADCHERERNSAAGGKLASDAFVSFPIAYDDVARPGNVENIRDAIEASGLPYGTLILALNGLDHINDVTAAKAQLSALRQSGARLAFADAMAGRSVLGNLHRYDFDTIKIDRGLISNADISKPSQEMVRTLVSLGRDLGLRIIADGVDEEKQRNLVEAMGCSFACGAVFGDTVMMVNDSDQRAEQNHDASLGFSDSEEADRHVYDEGVSLDEVSSINFPSRTPDFSPASQSVNQSNRNAEMTDGFSLDDLSLDALTATNTPVEQAPLDDQMPDPAPGDAPIKNIEAAFANTVPAFGADGVRSNRPVVIDSNAPDTALPKWRTWVKNMR